MTDVVITVHGTFAARESDEGDAWWQKGSDFANDLEKFWPGPVPVVPFHWNGDNSELARRAAARDLLVAILILQIGFSRIFVVAHSHGGNIVTEALISGMAEIKSEIQVVLVGTPYFQIGSNLPNRQNTRRPLIASLSARLLGATMLMGFLVFLMRLVPAVMLSAQQGHEFTLQLIWNSLRGVLDGTPFAQRLSESQEFHGFVLSISACVMFLGLVIVLLLLLRRRGHRKIDSRERVLAPRIVSIFDRCDEAISLLSRAWKAKGAVVPRGSAAGYIVDLLTLLAAVIFSVLGRLPEGITPGAAIPTVLIHPLQIRDEYAHGGPTEKLFVLAYTVASLLFFLSVVTLLISFYYENYRPAWARWLGATFGAPISGLGDDFFWKTLRASAFGNDSGETSIRYVWANYLRRISSVSEPHELSWKPLGEDIHETILKYCEENIVAVWRIFLEKFSEGTSTFSNEKIDIHRDQDTDFLSFDYGPIWSVLRLIHTSYFEIPIVRKLIIYSLIVNSPLEGKASSLVDDPEFETVVAAYKQIAPGN